ncbi:MAG TPA: hypothetical protein DCM64_05840 [Gammaproteobacteria bacterium]|jgi:hypothetical protein|nr:DUF3014 domain-containing protein [Gammaproteobacteria bacterium]MDP6733665.1 DUF3014 domain-containing protein [Gammaproteobacteria bacterium]HAJ75958.1 hypothetical protein [Gammaproteobacteria bacterium]|tara:strand:- start:1294 stop:2181 length:888 start_codon:yes stop_codon:yes gene_type:complete
MSKAGLIIIALVAVLTLLSLMYFALTFEAPTGTTTVVIQPPALQPAEPEAPEAITPTLPQIRIQPQPEPVTIASAEPVIEEPPVEVPIPEAVVEEPVEADVIQLPSLNNSDDFVFEGLRAIPNGVALLQLLANEQIVRKFVVFVENISRGEFPQTGLPYKGVEQEMPTRNIDDNLFVMDDSAHARFDQVIDTFVSIDTDAAMVFYRMLSPLFQQAYAEIGFRNVSFDDTLRSAITTVLRTTDVEGPYQLVKPSVMFLYADASIENLQEVHKQLIRIGPENTAKLKDKLQQFALQL